MKKMIKITSIVLLAIVILASVAFCIYWNININGYKKYERALKRVEAKEKQIILPTGSVINYGEVENDKPALLLIHGQMGTWEDYALVMPELSRNWHIYSIDVYGHGQSSHDEELYYLDVNGDDIIWFIDNVIKEKTVVSGHSNGAITAAYVAAYGGENIGGVILEDPPIFSTEGEGWKESFAYLDTYKPLHDYLNLKEEMSWDEYYLSHCLWGQLFMKDSMPGIAKYAKNYLEKHPGEELKIGFLPYSMWSVLDSAREYDFRYGDRFYDLTWVHGYSHEEILSNIEVPCVYIHAKETLGPDGIYLCAASSEQANRAVNYIGNNCRLVETPTSDHVIHTVHRDLYIDIINSLCE